MKAFGSFRLDTVEQCLWREDARIALTPKVFAVLRHLVNHPGRLVTQDELLEALGVERREALKAKGKRSGEGNWDSYLRLFKTAQKRVEARHYKNRVDLMVHEKQRQEILKDLGADPFVD